MFWVGTLQICGNQTGYSERMKSVTFKQTARTKGIDA
jgi:hypothetical protein